MSLKNLRVLNYDVNHGKAASSPDRNTASGLNTAVGPVVEKIYESDSPEEESRKIKDAYIKGILDDDEQLSSVEIKDIVSIFRDLYPDQRRFENKYYEVYASRDGGNFWSRLTSGYHCRYDEAIAVFRIEYAKDKNQKLKLVEITENVLASNNL